MSSVSNAIYRPTRAGLDLATLGVIAMLAVFLLAGVVFHDPWKPDEAYTFGIIHHIVRTGDWVVPTLGGEPFMEKPPLYYIVAALVAQALSPLVPLHDGARVASLVFVGLAVAFLAMTARRLYGANHAFTAAILLLGSVGFVFHAHTMITDLALLSGFAIAMYGIAIVLDRPRRGGAILGVGVGVGFLSKGLVEPAMVGIGALLLPIFFREWRVRSYATGLAWAAIFVLPWLLVWPAALYMRSPELFHEWFWVNNFGRYFGFARLGAYDEPLYFTRTLPWFTLPAGPLALYGLARALGRPPVPRGLQIAICLAAGMLVVLGTSSSVRELYALPILLPTALVGSAAVREFPRSAGLAMAAAGAVVAVAVALLCWGIWLFALTAGEVPTIPVIADYLPARFRFAFDPWLFAFTLAATALWIGTWRSPLLRTSWPLLWIANVALGWVSVMALMLPWLDNAKSFREPFTAMAARIPRSECVMSLGLGEGQRGMLDYVAAIETRRLELGTQDCRWLLLQSNHDGAFPPLPRGAWNLVWAGGRNGELNERFQLYAAQRPRTAQPQMAKSTVLRVKPPANSDN